MSLSLSTGFSEALTKYRDAQDAIPSMRRADRGKLTSHLERILVPSTAFRFLGLTLYSCTIVKLFGALLESVSSHGGSDLSSTIHFRILARAVLQAVQTAG